MTPQESAAIGNAIYEKEIRHLIEPVERAVSVMIDVHSGDWAVLDSDDAGKKLRERRPNGRFYSKRVAPPPQVKEVEVNGEIVQVLVDPDYLRRPRIAYGIEKMMRDSAAEQEAAEINPPKPIRGRVELVWGGQQSPPEVMPMKAQELDKLGNAIYEEQIRHLVEPVVKETTVLIEVNSGEWEISAEGAMERLLQRCPNPALFAKWLAPDEQVAQYMGWGATYGSFPGPMPELVQELIAEYGITPTAQPPC